MLKPQSMWPSHRWGFFNRSNWNVVYWSILSCRYQDRDPGHCGVTGQPTVVSGRALTPLNFSVSAISLLWLKAWAECGKWALREVEPKAGHHGSHWGLCLFIQRERKRGVIRITMRKVFFLSNEAHSWPKRMPQTVRIIYCYIYIKPKKSLRQ